MKTHKNYIFIHCSYCGKMSIVKRRPMDGDALVVQIDCDKCCKNGEASGTFSSTIYIGKIPK